MKNNLNKLLLLAVVLFMAETLNAQNWLTTGNNGTDTTINFIGTTDKKAFKIKTFGKDRITILANQTKVGIGTTNPGNMLTIYNDTALANLGIRSNFAGAYLILDKKHTTDLGTILYKTNTVLKWQIGAIGNDDFSLYNYTVAQNAMTVLGSNNNVGIGTVLPGAKLEIAGQIKITGGSPGAKKVLTSDANGLASWTNPDSLITNVTNPQVMNSTSNSTSGIIPDNSCTGLSRSITLSGLPTSVSSSQIKVTVNISMQNVKDLYIFLTAPNGNVLHLCARGSTQGSDFINTIFSDEGSSYISSGSAPYTGTYKPAGGFTNVCSMSSDVYNFSTIGGGFINPNGIWTMTIIDYGNYSITAGTLNSWSISTSSGGIPNYIPKWTSDGSLSQTSSIYDDGNNIKLKSITGGSLDMEYNPLGVPKLTWDVYSVIINDGGIGGIPLIVNGDAAKPGGGSWSTTSDIRMKKDIQSYQDGLKEVLKINPVRYHYNEKSGYDTKREYVGVIAQELKEVAPYMVGIFQKDGQEYYNVNNSAMTYMLINAVKELVQKIDTLENRNYSLQFKVQQHQYFDDIRQKQIEALTEQMKQIENAMSQCCTSFQSSIRTENSTSGTDAASLEQNAPNPFNEQTTIRYSVAQQFGSAIIQISDNRDQVLKTIAIKQSGKGELIIHAGELAAGSYQYSLIVDGKVIDAKQMVLTK